MIYLDNSATTKPLPEVLESFRQVSEKYYGNPSSIHRFGADAERLLLKAKQQAAQLMDVKAEELVFTSGGTEGNNLAVKGIAFAHQNRGRHIITSQIEHPSVIEACKSLEKLGFQVTYLPVNSDGVVEINDVKEAINDQTILISIMHVNNEIGSVQPILEIGAIAKLYPKLFFHVDDVQGFGKVKLPLINSGIDLCTISGHKIHGLKGTGLLYIKRNTTIFPLFHGGAQEGDFRSGTENVAGAVSLVKAMRLIIEKQRTQLDDMKTTTQLLRNCLEQIEGVVVNTPRQHSPNIINISVPGYKPEVVIHALSEKDIYISTKSACSSKKPDESAVLSACGFNKKISESALRISLDYDNTEDEVFTFCHSLSEVLQQLSEVMG
ncbi:aminotransferase class V-fold PLP-dependent enzyme [Aquibacillus halophilus]|uniref:Aminotransferase class V-fold PLP-dependent enzyme n=1 Tax=Aquibacillus halophilus TaxID=930132 RepID=A0A6A8DAR6_9BACI|nr:cysteine desulfurase family protein [Aquibacillus halophilus]MRH42843.1 aminotransferase class V-fold PLP-dependent enzyme [Aquibacillus halophilus]